MNLTFATLCKSKTLSKNVTKHQDWTYEEGSNNGIVIYNHLIPIERGNWVESQTSNRAGNGSQGNILWCDPGHPVEVTQRLKNVAGRRQKTELARAETNSLGEPEVNEHATEAVEEVAQLCESLC